MPRKPVHPIDKMQTLRGKVLYLHFREGMKPVPISKRVNCSYQRVIQLLEEDEYYVNRRDRKKARIKRFRERVVRMAVRDRKSLPAITATIRAIDPEFNLRDTQDIVKGSKEYQNRGRHSCKSLTPEEEAEVLKQYFEHHVSTYRLAQLYPQSEGTMLNTVRRDPRYENYIYKGRKGQQLLKQHRREGRVKN